jgi:phenylpropionate dioxygenase-like ring-hydroxylating dioxygenase large terminal subunit
MNAEAQERLVRTGPGTPGGNMQRSYWQPVGLSEDVVAGGAPMPVRIFSEDLVLYRDANGHAGLMARRCPHRGTDLAYARTESGGLRCIYHGWFFDGNGFCRDQPGVADRSTVVNRVRITSYPCHEAGGLIFTYMGAGEPPIFPNYEFLDTTDAERFVCKIRLDCNYFQGIEGNLDQVHLSFLHRVDPNAGKSEYFAQRTPGSTNTASALLSADVTPDILPIRTPFGMREIVTRKAPEGQYLKIENFVLPGFAAVPGPTAAQGGYLVLWHVPIDDENHWKYNVVFKRGGINKTSVHNHLIGDKPLIDYRFPKAGELYTQDRNEMNLNETFAGLGTSFALHDAVIVEAQGAICDRTNEILGAEDKSIALIRRLTLEAIADVEAGREPPHVIRDPAANVFPELIVLAEVVPAGADPKQYVEDRIARRPAATSA